MNYISVNANTQQIAIVFFNFSIMSQNWKNGNKYGILDDILFDFI